VHGKRLMSRTGAVVRATPVGSAEDIIQAAKDAKGGSVIIIDEAHFFDIEDARRIVASLPARFRVIVAGLDRDFRGEPWPSMAYLRWAAESVTMLKAVCAKCGEMATRTQRLIEGKPAPRSEEHTSEFQSRENLVCRLLLEKKRRLSRA